MNDVRQIASSAPDLPAAAPDSDTIKVKTQDPDDFLKRRAPRLDEYSLAPVSRLTMAVMGEYGEKENQWRKAFGEGMCVSQILLAVSHMFEGRIARLEENNAVLAKTLAETMTALDGRLSAFSTTLVEFERNERARIEASVADAMRDALAKPGKKA